MRFHEHLRRRGRISAIALVLLLLLVACGPTSVSLRPAPSASTVAPASQAGVGASWPRPCALDGGPQAERPWRSDRIFYEVFVRSFQDSDGDGIGDRRGLTAVADFELSLDAGPLCGLPRGEILFGPAATAGSPAITAAGGFGAYRPVERLGPREAIVIGLSP